jgi:hypothetical protein
MKSRSQQHRPTSNHKQSLYGVLKENLTGISYTAGRNSLDIYRTERCLEKKSWRKKKHVLCPIRFFRKSCGVRHHDLCPVYGQKQSQHTKLCKFPNAFFFHYIQITSSLQNVACWNIWSLFFSADSFTTLLVMHTIQDAVVLCDKAAVLRTTIKGTHCTCERVIYSLKA